MKKYIVLAFLCVLMASAGAATVKAEDENADNAAIENADTGDATMENAPVIYPGQQTFTLSSLPKYATCAAEAKVVNIKSEAAAYLKEKGLEYLSYTCGASSSWTVTGYKS